MTAVPWADRDRRKCTRLAPAIKIADHGVVAAIDTDPGLEQGLNIASGIVTYEPVASDQGLDYTSPREALGLPPNRLVLRPAGAMGS